MKHIAPLCIFLLPLAILSQDLQGRAIYRSERQMDMRLDSSKMDPGRIAEINEQIKKQLQKEYTLVFDQKESLYTENERLDAPELGQGGNGPSEGRQIRMGPQGSANLYKNTAEGTYTAQQELMGKLFLIRDSLKLPDWKLENEQKKIGKYLCYKAIWTRKVPVREFNSDQKAPVKTLQVRTTVVWYTPEIPINSGPDTFWGLPGLIMEVREDKFSLLCTEVSFNGGEKLEIKIPTKGKEVDQETYDEIVEKHHKELMERHGGGRKNGKEMISIRIGGMP
jgi:GLPGLI family protein